jgi:SAM-dependent methyltransferase
MAKRELLLGCGTSRDKKLALDDDTQWGTLVTLDVVPQYRPDVVWNLSSLEPLPFEDDSFDTISAYEVLEHIGNQGDWETLAHQFSDYWRVLKPNGLFYATVPCWKSMWAWGDPDHKRVINEGTLTFVNQMSYGPNGRGMTPMVEYRACYRGDFDVAHCAHSVGTKENPSGMRLVHDDCKLIFVLKAVKPARIGR